MWPFPFSLIQRLAWMPIWALTILLRPFLPKTHPWKAMHLSLRSWCIAGTVFAFECSMAMWVYILTTVFVILKYMER